MKFTAYDDLAASEGLRLTAYRDSVGVWTIGFGHTGPDVKPGMTITREQAERLLDEDIQQAIDVIRARVLVPLNQNQFDALAMLIFNIGTVAFANSTLLSRLNAGDYAQAADQFLVWNKGTIGGVKQTLPGLVNRRDRERALFLRPSGPVAPPDRKIPPAPNWFARLLATIFRRN